MAELTGFEDKVCLVFSSNSMYSLSEVKEVYKKVKSFDKLKEVMNRAALYNHSLMDSIKSKKEKKETCFLFHDWEKWEQYEEKGIMMVSLFIDKKKEYKYTDLRQRRKCKTCGMVQDRLIRGA